MQTAIGFWIFERRSALLGGLYVVFYSDDGFGNLCPIRCPIYAIETANA